MDGMLQLANLVRVCGKVEGRKKLQKIVHILQSTGHPFHEHFSYLHYGPYSSDVRMELDRLADDLGLLRERKPQSEYEAYSYTAESQLEELLDVFKIEQEPNWVGLARSLNDESAEFLEAVSTMLFLRDRSFHGNRLEERFKRLKPQLAGRFADALAKADEIKPVTTTA